MTFKRRQVTRTDSSQASIIEALEKAGCRVYVIGSPCDLLIWVPGGFQLPRTSRAPVSKWRTWQTLECKTAYGKKAPKARSRKDQERQTQFLKDTGTPVVTSPEEALRALHLIEFNLDT